MGDDIKNNRKKPIMPVNHDTQIALLNKDVLQHSAMLEKYDITIEKLTQVSVTLNQLIAVHDNRIGTQEERMDNHLKDVDRKIVDIGTKIDNSVRDHKLQFTEINKKIEKFDKITWVFIGVAIVVSLIAKINLATLVAILQ